MGAFFQNALCVGSILGSKGIDHTIELFVVNSLTDKEHGAARILENLFLFRIVLSEGAVETIEGATHVGRFNLHFLLERFLGDLDFFGQILGNLSRGERFFAACEECLVIVKVVTEICHLRKGALTLDSAGRAPGLALCFSHD